VVAGQRLAHEANRPTTRPFRHIDDAHRAGSGASRSSISRDFDEPPVGPSVAYAAGATRRGGEVDMKKIVGFALVIALVGSFAAWAGETSGKIQSVDPVDRAIVLDDGTKLWVAEGLPLDALREGARVKASYEERDGKNIVTMYEVE